MLLIPAIDLKDGKCVRLKQGRMEDDTVFSDDPVAVASHWVERGARFFEAVDELTLIVEGASKLVRDYHEFIT